MGGSFSFTPNADSVTEPGRKCVLSDPIDGIDADKLFEGLQKYVRDGKTKQGSEVEFNVEEKDGGCLVTQGWNVPEMFGGGTHAIYNMYKFDAAKKHLKIVFYGTKVQYDRGTPLAEYTLNILSDPVRVEFWADAQPVRSSGRLLKSAMDTVLKHFSYTVPVEMDQPALSDEGKLSVVSGPIEDGPLSPDSFWDQLKEYLENQGATALPDGSVVEERTGFLDVLGVGTKHFAKQVFNKDDGRLTVYEYGEDESLTNLIGVTTLQIHKSPFRLEQWNVQEEGRRAGEPEKKIVEPFIQKVLKFIQEG